MKPKILPLFSLFLALASTCSAQFSITAIGSASPTVTFAGYDGAAAPANFTAAGAGFPAFGGFYDRDGAYSATNLAYAFRDSSVSTDVFFGMKRGTTSAATATWNVQNNTGTEITSLVLTWEAIQVSQAGRATTLNVNGYSVNGGSVTAVGLVSTTFTATTDTTAANLASLIPSSQSTTITFATPIQAGDTVQLAWSWGNGAGAGANAHVGLDNISLTAVPEPSTYALIFGVAALGFAGYKRLRRT